MAGWSGRVWWCQAAAMGFSFADQKKLYIRQAEVFAAYAAYTDYEIGRVIQEVQDRANSTTL